MEQAREALKKLNVFVGMLKVPNHLAAEQAIEPPAGPARMNRRYGSADYGI
jgi:hypothetical protein